MAIINIGQSETQGLLLGLSTDTKPANPTSGMFFLELDTGKQYNVVGGVWTQILNSSYATPASLPNMANYAASSHTHTIANVTGLQGAIDGKQPTGSYLVAADIAGKANVASPAFTGSFGYAAGQGGSVVQATNKTTGVTLNKICGQITMNGAALAAAAEVAFTLTNSFISATDVLIVNIQSVGTVGAYLVSVGAVGNGSCSITVSNASAGSLSQALVINFVVIKAVNS